MARMLVAAMAFDSELGGGSVRIAYDLAMSMARRGHKVTIVCEDMFGRGAEREMVDGMTVLRYLIPKSRGINTRRHEEHIQAVKSMIAKYLKEEPEIVHGHNPFQYSAVLDLYKDVARCCYTIHSPVIEELRIVWGAQGYKGGLKTLFGLPIIRRLEKSLILRSSALTALSKYTVRLIADHYGDMATRNIHVIPGWVNPEIFKPLPQEQVEAVKRRFGWPTGIPVFFVLRRLEPRMGLDNLLNAIALIKKRGYAIHVAVGGSGSLRMHLEERRDALGLEKDFSFMGFVPADYLPMAYAACDASVVPSAQLECFGIIAIEALACGATTLVTPIGALPEVMRDIEPAWIARNASPEGIADLLLAWIRRRLPIHPKNELHEIIRNTYSAEKAFNAYERLLCQKNNPSFS